MTGRALFPTEVHATFDEGVWLPREAWDAVVPPNERGAGSGGNGAEELIAIRFEPGVSTEAGLARLRAQAGDRFDDVGPVDVPTELTNLRNVRSLPAVLASFLALLALAALSYVLLATTRARSRDFAVLRAIGFTRGQNRAVVGSQSAVVAVIGLLAGIPLGIVAGRAAWSLITERVPIEDVPPTAVVALAVFIPLALLAAGLTVVWPARRVNRIRPAEALRTE
jgi:predicted lysophospholipase L1 biosynthesis ABC-type transport system permease subunit